jgi:PH (Pleckstrin Homology) domain-containing protein
VTPPVSSPSARTWAPKVEIVVLTWVLTVLAAGWAVLTDDPPGRVLLGAVAVLLALAGLHATVARPRLSADQDGVAIRGLTGSRRFPWAEVNVRLVRTRRLGRDSSALEVDADNAEPPTLVVLGRLELGADPEDVVDELLALRT